MAGCLDRILANSERASRCRDIDAAVQVASGRRQNRSWPDALKREIVAASLVPGASVSLVARRYDVNTNQLFGWRKLYREGLLGANEPALVPVTVSAAADATSMPSGPRALIEIHVADYRVRVGPDVPMSTPAPQIGRVQRRVLFFSIGVVSTEPPVTPDGLEALMGPLGSSGG